MHSCSRRSQQTSQRLQLFKDDHFNLTNMLNNQKCHQKTLENMPRSQLRHTFCLRLHNEMIFVISCNIKVFFQGHPVQRLACDSWYYGGISFQQLQQRTLLTLDYWQEFSIELIRGEIGERRLLCIWEQPFLHRERTSVKAIWALV